MTKISFILPIYNVEQYLPRAISSLKAQTMTDWEAILVDDGSPDGCASLCDAAAAEDFRFKVIHKKNGGVSSARNAGIEAAKGEYIHFFDPDDIIEPDMAEKLTDVADENHADVVLFGLFEDYADSNGKIVRSVVHGAPLVGVYREEPFKRLFDKIVTYHLVAPKLFRSSLIKGKCEFPKKKIGEDGVFFARVYAGPVNCVVGVGEAYYHYIRRENSASVSFHEERMNDNFYLTKEIAKTVEKWGLIDSPVHLQALKYSALRDLQLSIKNASHAPISFWSKVRWLKKIMKNKELRRAVRSVPLSKIHGRNDKIKTVFLKKNFCAVVMLLSCLNK